MSEYEAGKDIQKLQLDVEEIKTLLGSVASILTYNIQSKKLDEPKEKK